VTSADAPQNGMGDTERRWVTQNKQSPPGNLTIHQKRW
jgi:hypothetical protein